MKKILIFLFYAFLAMLTACANPNIPQRQKPERPEDIMIPMNSEADISGQKGEGETKGGEDGSGFCPAKRCKFSIFQPFRNGAGLLPVYGESGNSGRALWKAFNLHRLRPKRRGIFMF